MIGKSTIIWIGVTCAASGILYQTSYKAQEQERELARLNREIRQAHADIQVLKAEWAYLNRPDRLRELVTLNFDRLGLFPMEPGQFGQINAVAMPPPPITADLSITKPVDVIGDLDPAQESTP